MSKEARKTAVKQTEPKIITFDTEVTPITVYSWDLYPERLSHDNIINEWSFICAAYKELGKDKVTSLQVKKVGDDKQLVSDLRDVLVGADIVIGQNIKSYDIRKLQARLIYHKLPPLPKLTMVDTLIEARKSKFTSNRLDYLGKHLLGEGKMEVHYSLWLEVMKGSKPAIKKMSEYCDTDVIRNEEIYLRLRPYMQKHPSVAILKGGQKHECPKCGSTNIYKHSVAATTSGTLTQRMGCKDCKGFHSVPFKQVK